MVVGIFSLPFLFLILVSFELFHTFPMADDDDNSAFRAASDGVFGAFDSALLKSSLKLDEAPCALCGSQISAYNGKLGPREPLSNDLRSLKHRHWVHRACAIWSPEVFEDESGNLKNIAAAVRRGKHLKCTKCDQLGATVGCRVPSCPKNYHAPCAALEGVEFLQGYLVSCNEHRMYPKKSGLSSNWLLGEDTKGKGKRAAEPTAPAERRRLSGAPADLDVAKHLADRSNHANDIDDDEAHFQKKVARRAARDANVLRPIILGGRRKQVAPPPQEQEQDPEQQTSATQKASQHLWGQQGLDDVKSTLSEAQMRPLREAVLLPLLYPDAFRALGVRAPKGVLLHGAPGTGKTLAVRALASACKDLCSRAVAFFHRSGADCLGKYAGESERTLRLLFAEARKHAPSVIFFDEIDALCPARRAGARDDDVHAQMCASVVTTLLALMDGVDTGEEGGRVVVLAATNRPDSLDAALRRPGRFDTEVYFDLPGEAQRLAILEARTNAWPAASRPDASLLRCVARETRGYAGADLAALLADVVKRGLQRATKEVDVRHALSADVGGDAAAPPIKDVPLQSVDWEEALQNAPPPAAFRSQAGGATLACRHVVECAAPLPADSVLAIPVQEALAQFRWDTPVCAQSAEIAHTPACRLLLWGDGEKGQTAVAAAVLHAASLRGDTSALSCSFARLVDVGYGNAAHGAASVASALVARSADVRILHLPDVHFYSDGDDASAAWHALAEALASASAASSSGGAVHVIATSAVAPSSLPKCVRDVFTNMQRCDAM